MEFKNLQDIIAELQSYAREVKQEDVDNVVDLIIKSERIFVAGAGRSGFAARGFANRLMHLGFNVNFVGEATTPPIKETDLLIVGSGSGTTAGLVAMVKKAKNQGAKIATITLAPEKTIGSMSEAKIVLPGTTRLLDEDKNKAVGSIQPVGSMFEQLSWLVYDGMVISLKEKTHQTNEDLIARHGNLE